MHIRLKIGECVLVVVGLILSGIPLGLYLRIGDQPFSFIIYFFMCLFVPLMIIVKNRYKGIKDHKAVDKSE